MQRHHFETGKAVYELDKGDHYDYIVCVKCGEVTEFHNPEIEALQDKIAEENEGGVARQARIPLSLAGHSWQVW